MKDSAKHQTLSVWSIKRKLNMSILSTPEKNFWPGFPATAWSGTCVCPLAVRTTPLTWLTVSPCADWAAAPTPSSMKPMCLILSVSRLSKDRPRPCMAVMPLAVLSTSSPVNRPRNWKQPAGRKAAHGVASVRGFQQQDRLPITLGFSLMPISPKSMAGRTGPEKTAKG